MPRDYLPSEIYDVRVTKHVYLTPEDIEDIVSTALCGGIGYWACLDNTQPEFDNMSDDGCIDTWVAKILMEGGTVRFFDEEDESVYGLTLEMLLNGIKLYVELGFDKYDCFTGNKVDLYNCDATVADAVFQLAIFNDIVYA